MSFCLVNDDILRRSLRAEYVQADATPLPSGHSTGWRTMPFFMFSQADSGAECIWLEDGRQIKAESGEMIILPAGVRHKVEVVSGREVRLWAHVNYFILGNVDLFTVMEVPILAGRETGTETGAVIREWVEKRPQYEANALLLSARQHEFALRLLALAAPLCRMRSGATEQMEGMRRLNPVIQHMQQHLDQPMGRDDMARMSGLSAAQFHVVFARVMHTTPMEHLRTMRLRHAQRLLITTATPIKEIAAACGYADPFVFCKFFKRVSGCSPTDYRSRTRL